MTDNVVPLRFNVQEVGKHVKSSKKRFTWEVSMNGRQHSIVLDFSFISGKVKVAVDRKILLDNELPANTSFQYPFTLDGNSLNVIQQGESFELRINNKVFSHLYNQAKTNKEFKKYEDQVKDFKVNENQFQAKKLTLNIGGVGGGMKKKTKNQSAEGHNWNAFGEDEMSGFPNYFDGQSTSTTASSKVEENYATSSVKKTGGDLLGDDSGINFMPKQQQKSQNILDFEAQMQKTPPQPVQPPTKAQDEFSTMQMMFQTMNLNQVPQSKPSVVIDSSEVDFFSSAEESTSRISQPQGQIDFFTDINTQPIQPTKPITVLPQSQPKSNDFNTMQYIFATNQGVSNNNSMQSAFSTSNPQQSQQWNTQSGAQSVNLGMNMGAIGMNTGLNMTAGNSGVGFSSGINMNTGMGASMSSGINMNTGINLGTQPVQQQINANNFSTLQGLFATNSLGVTQQPQPANTPVQQQANFSLNTQHFATSGVPTQGFGTSFGLNTQQFGTQNFMGQQQGFGQQINFMQKTQVQQPVVSSQAPVQQSAEINVNDFSSMQMLFQTNNMPSSGLNTGIQQPVVQPIMKKASNDSFGQQFATMGGSSTQSPNTMFMNTYGGSNSAANLSFDMSLGGSQANPSMMKKKPSETPVVQQSGNVSDLL